MGLDEAIDITAEQRTTVLALLERHLPNTTAWVYGSRAKWTARPQSDLDLVVFATPEQNGQVGELREAFEESNLPFRVDLFVWDGVPAQFREHIKRDHVVLMAGDGEPLDGRSLDVAGEWVDATIADIVASSRNALVGGPFGSNLVSRDYVSEGVPVIRGQNMGTRWVTGEFVFVTPHKAESLEANLARPGDVVLTQRGTLGQVSIVPPTLFEHYLVSQSQMKVTVNRAISDPLFLYYVLSSSEQQDYVRQNAIQTGVPHTNLGILRATPVPVPPLNEQRSISYILGTLDDKIELNRRMNETLEAMARALFKSWFVDFDPVRAKMAGRDTGLPKHLADLFPDRLVDSELGEIPEGWEVGTLEDVALLNPESWGAQNAPNEIIYVDLSNTKWGCIENVKTYPWQAAPSRGRRVLRRGDTIVGTVRPGNGSFSLIGWDGLTGSTGFAVLRPKMPSDAELVWCAATCQDNIDRLAHLADGGAYPAVRPEAVVATKLALVDVETRWAFSSLAASLLNQVDANKRQAHTLAALRETLLPKLISGEVRIGDGDKSVESIA